ncbi:hypothetical protein ABIB40_000468 [Pedobacter sp. UYP30]|uniref:DUF4350 domain-containing protein n=1 Tax=Pedobacter sp. UYP30 TaxID=1756400 RepID=UPI00339AD1D1
MKGYKTYLILGILFILIYLVAQYNKPTPTDWTRTFVKTDKIPFGTFIFYNSLVDVLPNTSIINSNKRIYNTLSTPYKKTAYVIIAPELKLDKADSTKLNTFVKQGNNAFIASYNFGKILSKQFGIRVGSNFSQNSTPVNFVNPLLKSTADYGFDKGIGDNYFAELDTAKATVLGTTADGKANFIKYKLGKGTVFLMADPGFYSNVNLLDKYGAEFASKSLSYLAGNKNIIYDGFFTKIQSDQTDLFTVFFKNPALKYAYYLAIFSLLLFVLYNLKRRQRIIPLQDPLSNASLEFVQVVGSVYYQNRNNQDIAQKKITYFLAYLRSRYFLKTNKIDKEFSELLVQKTGIHQVQATYLTKLLREIPEAENLSDHGLIDLNQSIENFYKNTQTHGTRAV